jgi:hypothetical protein
MEKKRRLNSETKVMHELIDQIITPAMNDDRVKTEHDIA